MTSNTIQNPYTKVKITLLSLRNKNMKDEVFSG
jgi:hypothetical protein